MKKIFLVLSVAVINQVCANSFEIVNKTGSPIKAVFAYTSPVCIKDSRNLAAGGSTGEINIGACMLHEMSVLTQGQNIIAGTMTNIARKAPGHSVYTVTQTAGGQSLTITMSDGRGNDLTKSVGTTATAVR